MMSSQRKFVDLMLFDQSIGLVGERANHGKENHGNRNLRKRKTTEIHHFFFRQLPNKDQHLKNKTKIFPFNTKINGKI